MEGREQVGEGEGVRGFTKKGKLFSYWILLKFSSMYYKHHIEMVINRDIHGSYFPTH